MSADAVPTIGPKRQRIMIINTEETITDESQKKQKTPQPSYEKKKMKDALLICVVCGSSANGYNFGAIVCESCKAFFRRNARKDPTTFHCDTNGGCRITLETRRTCSVCRLAKCFDCGMQRDRLMTDEQKTAKRRQIEENRALALKSDPIPNEKELEVPSSIFSDDLVPITDTDVLFTDFTDLLFPQFHQTLLSSEDLHRVETISRFYQNRIEFAARDGLPWDPSTHASTFLQVLNSYSVSVVRLLSFLKQIPEFNQLNVDDRVTLIKYNLLSVLGINSALSFNTETRKMMETDSDVPVNWDFSQVLHGYQVCFQSRKIFGSFLRIANYDRKIIELAVIIFILTKGFTIVGDQDEQILNDKMSVYRMQHYYTELLWKYIETMYGYRKAVDLFSELILHGMSWQTMHEEMRNNILRALSPEDVSELVPIMKSILRI